MPKLLKVKDLLVTAFEAGEAIPVLKFLWHFASKQEVLSFIGRASTLDFEHLIAVAARLADDTAATDLLAACPTALVTILEMGTEGLPVIEALGQLLQWFGRDDSLVEFLQGANADQLQRLVALTQQLVDAPDVVSLITQCPKLLGTLLKMESGAEAIEALNYLTALVGQNGHLLEMLQGADADGLSVIIQIVEQLKQNPTVVEALRQTPDLMEMILREGPESVAALAQLLNTEGMTLELLLNLFSQEGMTIETLKGFLAQMPPEALKEFLGRMTVSDLQSFLDKMPAATLNELLNEGMTIEEIKQVFQGNCFVAGTKVLTTKGEKNIEDIQVGDWVIADDPTTPGDIAPRQVLDTYVRHTNELFDLYIDGEVISTTGEHPFWVPDQSWVKAKDLQLGTVLQTEDGRIIDVDGVSQGERVISRSTTSRSMAFTPTTSLT